jgi:hypothetical protein
LPCVGKNGGMAHNLSDRQHGARMREFQREMVERDQAKEAQDHEHAAWLVQTFNARIAEKRRILSIPTIGCALLAGHPWLHVVCRRCGGVKAIDLSFRSSRPNSPVTSVVPFFVCTFCDGRHPIPRVLRLSRYHEPGGGPIEQHL